MDLRLGLWLGGLGFFALWESLAPDRSRGLPRMVRWPSNLGLGVISSALLFAIAPAGSVGAASWAEFHGIGLLRALGWDGPAAAVSAVVVLDLALWAQHVVAHRNPWFWRVHRVHHLDTDLDVTSASRFHPLEILVSQAWMSLVVVALGVSTGTVLIHATLVALFAQFNHANIRLPDSVEPWVALLLATPTFHRVHHSVFLRESETHFGNVLSIWDRLAGTTTRELRGGKGGLVLGVDPWRDGVWQRLDRLLLHPFTPWSTRGKP